MTHGLIARQNLIDSLRKAVTMLKFNPGQGLESIQAEYNTTLYGIMDDFFNSPGRPVTSFRNAFRRAVNDAFNLTVVAGWADAGASGGIDETLQGWTNDRISTESGYADELFESMKQLKEENAEPDRIASFISQRADGYTNTLVGVYAYAKMYAQKNRPGKWVFGDTVDHCETCSKLEGSTHPLSWFIDNNYIPQESGSATLECGGYYCQCTIVDPESGEVLIP